MEERERARNEIHQIAISAIATSFTHQTSMASSTADTMPLTTFSAPTMNDGDMLLISTSLTPATIDLLNSD